MEGPNFLLLLLFAFFRSLLKQAKEHPSPTPAERERGKNNKQPTQQSATTNSQRCYRERAPTTKKPTHSSQHTRSQQEHNHVCLHHHMRTQREREKRILRIYVRNVYLNTQEHYIVAGRKGV